MIGIETRELEYFIAVAEELHFGRAADRLIIAQPALSKAIRRIEARLGVELFERSNRHVSLTASGQALLERGRPALDAVSLAVEGARRAGDPDTSLRLVLKPGGDADLLPLILAAYAERPNARGVEILFGRIGDRVSYLREGRADIALLYAPFDDLSGMEWVTLLTQQRVAILPRKHRLARRRTLLLKELEGETLPNWQGTPSDGDGPEVADMAQLLHLIAVGRTIAILPRSAIGPSSHQLVYVPVVDAEASTMVLAWPTGTTSPTMAEFVEAALSVRERGTTGASSEAHESRPRRVAAGARPQVVR